MSQSEGQKFLSHLMEKRRWVRFHTVAQAVAEDEANQNLVPAIQAAVRKTFGIQSDDFANFDLAITQDIAPLGITPGSAADPAPQNLDAEDIAREYEKRRAVNALMQGGAVVAALEIVRQSDLPIESKRNYTNLLAAGTFQQLVEQVGGAGGGNDGARPPAGVVEVSHDDSGLARIHARAVDGAVLAHEAAKGLMELAAMWGVPGAEDNEDTPSMIRDYNAALRSEVMRRADRPEHELEDITRGIVLWVDHFGKTIGPETLNDYQTLCSLPAADFMAALTGKPEAPTPDIANNDNENLFAMLDENLRANAEIKHRLDTDILPHANLPDDEAARTAIINWVTGTQLRNYLTAQEVGAAALTKPEMNNQLKHVIDYLHTALTDGDLPKEFALTATSLQASTYQVIGEKAEKWMAWQSRQAIDGVMTAGVDYDVVMELEGGMRLVELKTPLALDWEGQQMGHCIGGSYDARLNGSGGYRQYSLWDEKGMPHCTFEVNHGSLQQCQGKKNQPPVARYVPAVMAVILAKGWKLGDIPASRTGLVTDWYGEIYSVHDLPEVFDGDLPLNGLQTDVRLPRHVKGSVEVRNATGMLDLSRFEKADSSFNADGTPMKEITTTHLRAIQVRGTAIWPMGVISDKRGRFYSAYDLCDPVFDGDVDLSGTQVKTLGQRCKKITGSVFNGVALVDTGAVEEIGGDIRSCHALQTTQVRKVGGNLAGLMALSQADYLEEVGKSTLILPEISDLPRLRYVGKNFYLNSTAIERVTDNAKIKCIRLPDDHVLKSVAATNQWLANPVNKLSARRAAKAGRIEIGGDEWNELVDIQQVGDILPDRTILYAKQNNEAWMAMPKNLPNYVSSNELAKDASEKDIQAQEINIHAQFVKQKVDDHGYTDWFLPKMTGKDKQDECWALYQASDKGALKGTLDKSGSVLASYLWSARRSDDYGAYFQWLDDGRQGWRNRTHALSVRGVRRKPQRTQGAALVI